ncbi:MAG: ParA family protein [Leptospiraceae bacterium]|nr:ParA family protein [Leptospiraceae bacterium]MCP5493009.1 ParA family protein [Leptospiraceae bacterium]
MASVIAVSNQKGGVGKTTTTIHIASGFARKNLKVLCIDLDPCLSLSMHYRFGKRKARKDISHLYKEKNVILEDYILPTDVPQISLIHGSAFLYKLDKLLLENNQLKVSILKSRLKNLKNHFDYIVIDTAPGMNNLLFTSVFASDLIVIPMQADFLSMNGVSNFIDIIKAVEKLANQKFVYKFLINMYDPETDPNQKALQIIQRKLSSILFQTVVSYSQDFKKACNQCKSLLEFQPYSEGANQYIQLVEEICDLLA